MEREKIFKIINTTVAVLASVVFVSFWIFSLFIGGDAINGYNENGVYYVASHGEFTEVSYEIWISNFILFVVSITLFIAEFSIMAISAIIGKKKKDRGLTKDERENWWK